MKVVLQSQRAECSLACLAMVASAHGQHHALNDLRRRFAVSLKGATLRQLMRHAAALGFSARPLRLELDELRDLRVPCVLHWDLNHFVVLKAFSRGRAVILDPAVGERRLSLKAVSSHFTGVALELMPNADFRPQRPRARMRLSQLTGRVFGLKRALAQVFAMALALEVFALVGPVFNQFIVDEVLASGDRELLTVLVLGFGLLLAVQAVLGLGRSWLVMVLGQNVSLQWTGNVFVHLLRLPVEFFERRHLGDVASRFAAVEALRKTLTTSFVEAVLDGLMAVAALGMMWLYAPPLALVSCVAVAAYILLRWAAWKPLREAAAERLNASAREHSHFLETLRAIQPIKLFGREDERRVGWQNLVVDVQNADARSAKMNIVFSAAHTLVFGAENLAVLWLGALRVMSSQGGPNSGSMPFTIGMLLAYLGYKGQFLGRVSALVGYVVELKMLGLHAERLADIALHPPEDDLVSGCDAGPLASSLELRDVSFRYADGDPWILRHANLSIAAGERVAITGPSGSGKTTLLKIVLGVLRPTSGEVLYGGLPMSRIGWPRLRRQLGTVMQDDVLLSGSLCDNISFFDAEPDLQRVEASARQAQIHAEIVAMPMGYQTLVGDLGSGLSGGQKQRLLLARALYKQPQIVVLDEATNHLDEENEAAVSAALAGLERTCLVISHRPTALAGVDRIVRLEQAILSAV